MPSLIQRTAQLLAVEKALATQRIVMLLGARQVGKTTLAKMIAERWRKPAAFFDLEDPRTAARLRDPMLVLEPLRGLVILDEVQMQPAIFPALRVLADRPRAPARFLLLGSASFDLIRRGSETLAGRVAFHDLPGLGLDEVGTDRLDRLWLRGGFPRSFLGKTDAASARWRRDFIRTFVERDLPQLGVSFPSNVMGRFWAMMAHLHGQLWNASEIGSAFGVAHTTVRRYLDALEKTLVVRQLRPWFENIAKRQVKAPKVFIADTGILHGLLGVNRTSDLEVHPKVGASWEGFMLDAVARRLGAHPNECYFWATHGGAELDLLVVRGSVKLGFEFKRTDSPAITPSMRSAIETLGLKSLAVIHAGAETFPLSRDVQAIAARDILDAVQPLRA